MIFVCSLTIQWLLIFFFFLLFACAAAWRNKEKYIGSGSNLNCLSTYVTGTPIQLKMSASQAGVTKGTPGDTKCVTESRGGGDKNKEVGGTKFKFGQLNLRKIIKIVATRCQNAPNSISAGAPPPDPTGGAHITPPDTVAAFNGREGTGKRKGEGEIGGGKGRGRLHHGCWGDGQPWYNLLRCSWSQETEIRLFRHKLFTKIWSKCIKLEKLYNKGQRSSVTVNKVTSNDHSQTRSSQV